MTYGMGWGSSLVRIHHAALPYAEMGGFMHKLRQYSGTGARALEFGILTAARLGEIRGAKWQEIDIAAGTWVIRSGALHFTMTAWMTCLERPKGALGTLVLMWLSNQSTRTTKEIFDKLTAPDEYRALPKR
jgi:integrase